MPDFRLVPAASVPHCYAVRGPGPSPSMVGGPCWPGQDSASQSFLARAAPRWILRSDSPVLSAASAVKLSPNSSPFWRRVAFARPVAPGRGPALAAGQGKAARKNPTRRRPTDAPGSGSPLDRFGQRVDRGSSAHAGETADRVEDTTAFAGKPGLSSPHPLQIEAILPEGIGGACGGPRSRAVRGVAALGSARPWTP
jgi:hypothetical protein